MYRHTWNQEKIQKNIWAGSMKYGSITGTGGRLDTKVRINEKGSEGERFHTMPRKTLSLKKKQKKKNVRAVVCSHY